MLAYLPAANTVRSIRNKPPPLILSPKPKRIKIFYNQTNIDSLKTITVGDFIERVKSRIAHLRRRLPPGSRLINPNEPVGVVVRPENHILNYILTLHKEPMVPFNENYSLEVVYAGSDCPEEVPKLSDFEIISLLGEFQSQKEM